MKATLELDRERAAPLSLEEVGPEEFRADSRWLDRELPAVAVTDKGSARFTCGNEHLWLVLGEGITTLDKTALPATDQVAAVVLKESSCSERWYVQEYVLTHPLADGIAAVFGVRSTGKLVHSGTMSARNGGAVVELRAVDTPGVAAMEFRAGLIGGELAFREASSGPARGSRKNRPQAPNQTSTPRPSSG